LVTQKCMLSWINKAKCSAARRQSFKTRIPSPNFHPPNPAAQQFIPHSLAAGEKMSYSPINYTTNSHNNTQYSNNTNAFNNTNTFNNDIVYNVNIGATDERSEILAWLSPLEPRIRHQDVRTRRADNVGEWLLQTGEFRRWRGGAQHEGSDHQILFCCSGPGVGKTYLR